MLGTLNWSCLSNTTYCAICAEGHLTLQHDLLQQCQLIPKEIAIPTCINCLVAGLIHNHKATSCDCAFFAEHNNWNPLTNLLNIIRDWRMEGFPNPFGSTCIQCLFSPGPDASLCSHRMTSTSAPTNAPLPAQVAHSILSKGKGKAPALLAHINNYYPAHPSVSTLSNLDSSSSMNYAASGDLSMTVAST